MAATIGRSSQNSNVYGAYGIVRWPFSIGRGQAERGLVQVTACCGPGSTDVPPQNLIHTGRLLFSAPPS